LGDRQVDPSPEQGTAVKQNYQTIDVAVRALAVPDAVSVALGEVVADVREGLLAMAWARCCR
jgi:hypothetical protein